MMSVQPQEHTSSSTTPCHVKLQRNMLHNGTRRRPTTAPNSTSPSVILPPSLHLRVIPPKAESKTHDGSSPPAATLGRIFSRICNLGTNAGESREITPAVPNQSDDTVIRTGSMRKRLLRHPSRRFSTPSQTSSSQHATPYTLVMPLPSHSPFSPDISVGDDTEEGNDEPSGDNWDEIRLQMARLAKLKRHLGEEIPLEMVLSPALLVDTVKSRGLEASFSNSKKCHQKQRSLDPTSCVQSAPALPRSRLSKSKSLRGREDILKYGDHAVELGHTKLPYEFPRTEVDCPKPREPRIRAPACGSDNSDHSTHRGIQRPRHLSMSLGPTSGRLQIHENLITTDLALDDPLNTERRETTPEKSVNTRSRYPVGDLGVRPSLSTQAPAYSDLEVDVQISRRTRFWQMKVGRNVVQSVHPDDITQKLRAMKAST